MFYGDLAVDQSADEGYQPTAQTGYSRNELIGKLLEYAVEHCTIADK